MQSGYKKVIGLILAIVAIILFVKLGLVKYFYFVSVNNQHPIMIASITTQIKFKCSTLSGLTFIFPVFANWEYQGIETGQPDYCSVNVRLPISAKISSHSPNVLKIFVFKTNEPSSLVGQIKLQGTNKNNITYTLYDNNELRFKDNNETIIIRIVDRYTFGGVDTGSMAIDLPTKENGFDYDEFWKQVIENLKYKA